MYATCVWGLLRPEEGVVGGPYCRWLLAIVGAGNVTLFSRRTAGTAPMVVFFILYFFKRGRECEMYGMCACHGMSMQVQRQLCRFVSLPAQALRLPQQLLYPLSCLAGL